MRLSIQFCTLLIVIITVIIRAPIAAAGTVPVVPTPITLRTISGQQQTGEFQSVTQKSFSFRKTGSTKIVTIPFSNLLRIQFHAVKKKTPKLQMLKPFGKSTVLVMLTNGDRIRLSPTHIKNDELIGTAAPFTVAPFTVKRSPINKKSTAQKQTVKIPLAMIRGILFSFPKKIGDRNKLERTVLSYQKKNDRLILRNGDQLLGRFSEFDATSVTLQTAENTKRKTAHREILALSFNPRYAERPKKTEIRIQIQLQNGSRITAIKLGTTKQNNQKTGGIAPFLSADLATGGTLQLPISAIVSMRVSNNQTVSIAELKPAVYQHTPFLGGQWKPTKNRSVIGGRLLLRGQEFATGLGLHSRCRITYPLNKTHRSFFATVGIDDAATGNGNVRVAIELDGKQVYRSPIFTGKSAPLFIKPISVVGKKQITLIVEFAQFGDINDLVNWCDAVLVTTPNVTKKTP